MSLALTTPSVSHSGASPLMDGALNSSRIKSTNEIEMSLSLSRNLLCMNFIGGVEEFNHRPGASSAAGT